MAAVTIYSDFGAQKNKVSHYFHCFPTYLSWSDGTGCHDPPICHEVMGLDAMILNYWMLSFKPTFSLSSFTFIKRLLSFSSLLPKGWCHLCIWGHFYLSQQSWFQLVFLPARHFSWCTLHIRWISRVTIYNLDVLLSLIGLSLFFHVQL